MTSDVLAPADAPLAAVLVHREKIEQATAPDIKIKDYAVLKDGPQAYKVAIHWVIVDRNTKEFHHDKVRIETYYRRRAGWKQNEEFSITLGHDVPNFDEKSTSTLGEEATDELQKLTEFLRAIHDERLPDAQGEYLVLPVGNEAANDASLRRLLEVVSDAGKAAVVAEALETAKGDPDVLRAVAERAATDPEASKEVAAVLDLASFKTELQRLDELIESNALEGAFQQLLARNPWMFGSEYSRRLDERTITVGQQQDFMLRRTVDGYLEIVEIQRPLAGQSHLRGCLRRARAGG